MKREWFFYNYEQLYITIDYFKNASRWNCCHHSLKALLSHTRSLFLSALLTPEATEDVQICHYYPSSGKKNPSIRCSELYGLTAAAAFVASSFVVFFFLRIIWNTMIPGTKYTFDRTVLSAKNVGKETQQASKQWTS